MNHLSLFSNQVTVIGKHKRPITALSNVIIEESSKLFYSGSRDG